MRYEGLVCGIVEDNLDPWKIGRVKARIPSLHGSDPSNPLFIPTKSLEWVYPCMPFYAAYDCGSFIVPPVGSYLWMMETAGANSNFVYLGGVYGTGATNPKIMNVKNPSNPNKVSMGQYKTDAGINEIPADLQSDEYAQSGVIFKSQKGHTIKYSDQDNKEYFEIIDRSGQSIRFDCPVSKEKNKGNASRRKGNKKQSGGKITITSNNSKIEFGDTIKLQFDGKEILSASRDKVTIQASHVEILGDVTTISGYHHSH